MDMPAATRYDIETHRTLVEALTAAGTAAFGGDASPNQSVAEKQFSDLLERTRTTVLLPALNTLIQPGRLPDAVRAALTEQLALVPLRPDGVRATLEFVFAVHPSNTEGTNAAATGPQKQGAQITLAALQMAAQLLARPPSRASTDDWFRGIAPQLLALLDGHDGLELAKAAAYVIGFGILGRKSFGAPGMPGWLCFAEPILRCIDPTTSCTQSTAEEPSIVHLHENAAAVLVSDADVAQGLRRLQTLVLSHPNPGLTRRLLHPLALPLWALASWPHATPRCVDDFSQPARNLLTIYLRVAAAAAAADRIVPIVRDLLFDGVRDTARPPSWQYCAADARGDSICIVSAGDASPRPADLLQARWDEIGPKCDAFVDLLASVAADDADIADIFVDLIGRWLASKQRSAPNKTTAAAVRGLVLVADDNDDSAASNPFADLLEGSILHKMMERFPEKLAGRPDQILALVAGLLCRTDDDDADVDTLPLLLSLLNLVVTSPGFRRAKADASVVQSIEASLKRISCTTSSIDGADEGDDNAKTASNLLLFLRYRDDLEEPGSTADGTDVSLGGGAAAAAAAARRQQQAEDRKTYSLALSYITQADAPPPVRSEGLNLLQGLVQANSAVLDIPAVLVLLASLLDGSEDYVNLRVIKLFTLLANRHPRATTRELLDYYIDARETRSLDARLRFGEALLQVVERLGETFTGDTARQVGEALLEIAGRRSRRPKTEAKQGREERIREMRRRRAGADGHGGDSDDSDNDLSIDAALATDEEKQRNAVLDRIVAGWGSQSGREDVRVRASALSILATALDVNIAGLGATLSSAAVDVALHVLALEPGLATGILRRAAIVLLLSFVRALHAARTAGRRLGFGLTPQSHEDMLCILRYVAATDDDGLVKQHAVDVIESLENWQLAALLPSAGVGATNDDSMAPLTGLTKLAGLSIHPPDSVGITAVPSADASSHKRPRIEEIE